MSLRAGFALASIALLAAVLRLAALHAAEPLRPVGDEAYYVQVAEHMARGSGHLFVLYPGWTARAWRPPLHPWTLSLLVDGARAIPGDPASDPALLRRMALLQVAISTLLVILTFTLGRALFDEATGVLAASIVAVYPALVAHSHYLWSETLFAALVTGALIGVVAVQRCPTLPRAIATGAVFGLATLTREVAFAVAGACVAWWWWTAPPPARRRLLGLGAVALLVSVLVVAPWTLRNYRVLGRLVPVSTVGWFALAEGNSLEFPRWMAPRGPVQLALHRAYFSTRDEVARLDLTRRHAITRIRAEQPGWLGKKLVRNLALLLNPDSVLRMKLGRGSYGERPDPTILALLAASTPSYLALVVAAAFGIAGASAEGRRALACLVLATVAALHVAANATPRFRVPWLPLLAVYAAYALVHRRGLAARAGRVGGAGVLAFLAFFFAVCVPYFWIFGGRP